MVGDLNSGTIVVTSQGRVMHRPLDTRVDPVRPPWWAVVLLVVGIGGLAAATVVTGKSPFVVLVALIASFIVSSGVLGFVRSMRVRESDEPIRADDDIHQGQRPALGSRRRRTAGRRNSPHPVRDHEREHGRLSSR